MPSRLERVICHNGLERVPGHFYGSSKESWTMHGSVIQQVSVLEIRKLEDNAVRCCKHRYSFELSFFDYSEGKKRVKGRLTSCQQPR